MDERIVHFMADKTTIARLKELQDETGFSWTTIIRDSIDRFYDGIFIEIDDYYLNL